MNNTNILIALHHIENVGWKTIQTIVNRFPVLSEMLYLQAGDWQALGLTASRAVELAKNLNELTALTLENLLKGYNSKGIGIVSYFDEDYPDLLKETAQPPWVLYYRGNPKLMKRPCIAVVGTRTPTVYGRKTAEQLSEALSASQLCVVSGMARGIDSAAHEAALRESGSTIAVLGCSIEHVYPPENKLLYHQIADKGLILSEYPLKTKPHPGLFPQRNRIIAGLSLGVLVVEAALRSGSLITVDQALEESRDVFAVPGPISSPKSKGTLSLIKQGAKLVSDVQDILEEYTHLIPDIQHSYSNHTQEIKAQLSPDEQVIVNLLQNQALSIDELLAKSQFNFGHLHAVLLNLLLTKRVEQLSGSIYALN
ncbi:DNA-protecting protein DprA [Paenibacillus sp. LMG 31456]|uniref:DNA-protecting protein DprA n=1 Tax=Paenibacillus foliorum TaxID=2654974 RepID=A0A972K042_9BACL|nr:DNA-processing protein DprA [Paenibacillus foliorum]NOU93445.1 DNA-protecting protein DprA [Paenibacillus foliorum]